MVTSAIKQRVLVVDDNLMIRQLVSSQLSALGFLDNEKAVNGVDAFNKLEHAMTNGKPYEIVLLDWNMPEMNGFEFLMKCRNDSRFSKLAIIMLTAESEQKNILLALKSGATSYIVKPLTVDILQKKLDDVIHHMTNKATKAKAHA